MGISILWIMLFHAGFEAPDNMILRALWYFFISFGGGIGVPIFLILSGMGLMYSELRNSHVGKWNIWANKRFIRIIPAYIIVASIYYFLKGESLYGVGYNLIFLNFVREGQWDFWYIALIIFCYAIFPFVVSLCRKYSPLIVIVSLSVLSWIIAYSLNLCMSHIYRNVEIFIHRIPCFLMGIYIGYLLYNKRGKEYNYLICSCLILEGLIFFLPYKFIGDMRWTFTFMSFPVLCLISAIIPIFKLTNKIFIYLGKRSLEIYLVHVSFGNMLLKKFPDYPIFELILYFVCSLLIAEVIYKLDNFIKNRYECKCYSTDIQR